MDYVKFEPAKVELCEKSERDEFYLFNNQYILLSNKDGYILPTRKDVEKYGIDITTMDCIASYKNRNCYTGKVAKNVENDEFKFVHLREYVENVKDENRFQLASRASMLKDFRDKNQVCSRCGSEVVFPLNRNDRVIKCTNCNQAIWPTNSPAVIVAVIRDDKLLLVKDKYNNSGEFGVISGFLDLGETFEDAVRREVLEETGIKIKNIKYFGSQPWAFPNSMMTGFVAEYLSGELRADGSEILEAKWFTKMEVLEDYRVSRSIGTKLIDYFLENNI